MFKKFIKDSCKSLVWLASMTRELTRMLCDKIYEIASED